MNIDLAGGDWIGRGWLLLLAFTATVLVVAAMRKLCRRLFGTERAFQLWALPPLAMLASQLPHAAGANHIALSTMVYTMTQAASALPAHAAGASIGNWRSGAMAIWCVGAVLFLLLAAAAQWRYRQRLGGATLISDRSSPWPVWRAHSIEVGPALVGAWRAHIVLPADFERRYDAIEQRLILAHEFAHARRRDGCWRLAAQLVAAVLWFHPLAWWALSALRHDQELACDAAVLRKHVTHRRNYANAMLKTQSVALELPVGCAWSPRHPLTERIAMLKLPLPEPRRHRAGMVAGFVLAVVVAGSAYAASAPQTPQSMKKVQGSEYQLDMRVELVTDDGRKRHAETTALALCVAPGVAAMVSLGALKVEATATPVGAKQIRIDLAVANAGIPPLAHSRVQGALGATLHVAGSGADGKHTYSVDVTPQTGCPARALAEASPVRVTEHITNGTARAVAESIAGKAGWVLVNPDALGVAPVTLSFKDMPAGTALQRVAEIAGMRLVLKDNRARFEPK